MHIRHLEPSDYEKISPLINDWWHGRQMAQMVPKLFFVHFSQTSFIAEEDGEVIGFLIGFLSQTYLDESYIHFAGVDPNYRKQEVGRRLYETFFKVVKVNNRNIVRAVTSPVNKGSVAYHTKMGFEIEEGDKEIEGIPVVSHYDGRDKDRVLFKKVI
ncbi:GNAT family N-acetyltransferase [Halobacillus mangrovi]|uniref:GNAT family N-acetyltransferase n=1 Tax=Halobacillus mangrovi TaxID=402384 RepID=A0A1W5ZWV2_9BACI|nr:GNAT family N-acetyltransferase [Halobacillus mangrovi]ARI77750.1 GNAT family N-acetyltransferase [Halobacillus mangrovi]